ncbi:MAG: hypothetical protein KBD52_03090 [Candidatus Pacebacteria bacterium]|nr:hypothetical protein [Candidatus Paceibacterota bacterium]
MHDGVNGSKNIKDVTLSLKDTAISISYTKTNKLITALYMVTDILDNTEPLRHKMRVLGADVLSDMYLANSYSIKDTGLKVISNINAIVSFLDLSFTLGMISEMNVNILKKEFLALKSSLQESVVIPNSFMTGGQSLHDFFNEVDENLIEEKTEVRNPLFTRTPMFPHNRNISQGHASSKVPTRIGVQKGSTLLRALSDKMGPTSNAKNVPQNIHKEEFELIKKERRNEILNITKSFVLSNGQAQGATITDINSKAQGHLKSMSEKTLQRELVSMVQDGVLYKTGSKRWSRYFVKN